MRKKSATTLLFDNMDTNKQEGAVIRKPGSQKLYVLFYYYGKRVEKTTGLDDTQANRKKIRNWLDRQMEKIEEGRFVFAEAFPSAPDAEKSHFAKLEGWNYAPSPRDILMGEYLEKWDKEVVELFNSSIKRFDYRAIIKCWIKPYFADKTFHDLTRLEMKKFVGTLKCKIGKKKGQTLSRSRVSNIISIIRALFNDASDEFHWDNITDPFRRINKLIPNTPPEVREIFRIDEWMKILEAIPVWYRPMLEMMMLTGLIHSEISGLLRSHIRENHIMVQRSIVRKVEKDTLKNIRRMRKITITKRIREILDQALARTDSPYVFAQSDGTPYLRENFTERIWTPAVMKCDIPYRPPYSIRHSFAAWGLLVGIDPIRMVKLMGHGSKKMIYDVYGNYIDGLEDDYWDIVNYFGKDFIEARKRPLPFHYNLLSESFGESQGPECHNQLIVLNK